MKILKLYHMEDSFASFNSPESNFSKFAYLKVGGANNKGYDNDLNKAFLRFNLSSVNSISNISKIELDLYVRDITSEEENMNIGIYLNKDNFWQSDVNWSNSPNINEQLGIVKVNKKSKNSYISIDITAVALEWIKNNEFNNGITLLAEGREDSITFVSSRGYNAPILKVHYNNDKVPYCYEADCVENTSNRSEKNFMLITAGDSNILEMGQTIAFGNAKNSNAIKYKENGEIIISKSGKYLVNFWMNCKNESDDNNKIEVNLIECTNDGIMNTALKASSNESIMKGETITVAATGTLEVNGNKKYKFINVANNNIKLASINNNFAASILISKIE